LWGAYIAYTVEAKIAMLGLEEDLIRRYGAVSRETACAMAQAALNRSGVDIAVAVTGLAGPEGDGTAVPVGTVWIATVLQGSEATARVFHYTGSRQAVRVAAAEDLIRELLRQLPVSAEVG
jgi:PncC family amidohydrolase